MATILGEGTGTYTQGFTDSPAWQTSRSFTTVKDSYGSDPPAAQSEEMVFHDTTVKPSRYWTPTMDLPTIQSVPLWRQEMEASGSVLALGFLAGKTTR